MKITPILFLLLISYTFCTINECNLSQDQTICNDIDIEIDGLSCYKVNDDFQKCLVFPDDPKNQKLYWKLKNGIKKEISSSTDYDIEYYENFNQDKKEEELIFTEGKKDSYNLGETIEEKATQFSSKDLTTIKSKNTCSYLYYGRFYGKSLTQYPDIQNKSVCFNAEKFDDFNDLVDCGYSTIKFITDYETYTINTCYFISNENIPSELEILFKSIYYESLREEDDKVYDSSELHFIFYLLDNIKHPEKYGLEEGGEDRRRRRLTSFKYEIVVENEKGRTIKYSSDTNQYETIAKGNGKEQNETIAEGSGKDQQKDKATLNSINIILLLLVMLLSY